MRNAPHPGPVVIRRAAFLALAAGLAASPLQAGRTEIDRGVNLFSKQQDVEMGREAAAEAEKKLPILADPLLTSYVRDVGLRVAKVSSEPGYPYEFKVVDSSDINAFALPGGFIYVNRGILEAAADESELAGVLAHEVGHVAARHGTNQLSKQLLVQMPLAIVLGTAMKDASGWKGTLAKLGIQLGMNAVFLSYSRKAETQADVLATQALHDAGLDPTGTSRFFEKLASGRSGEPSRLESFLASHPDPGNRAARVTEEVRLLGAPDRPAARASRDFDRMKARLARLPPPRGGAAAPGSEPAGRVEASREAREREAREREARERDVARDEISEQLPRVPVPSARSVRYRAPAALFRAAIPRDWSADEDGDGSVTMAPDEARRGGSLSHAVIVRPLDVAVDGRRVTLDDALDRAVDDVLAASTYLRERKGARRRTTLDGVGALETTLEGRVRDGSYRYDEMVTVTVCPLGRSGAVAVLAIVPEADRRAFRPAMDALIESLRFR